MMTPEETAWCAGVLESEGCFHLQEGRYPRVRVMMTDRDVLERLRLLVSGKPLRVIPKRQAHHKQAWQLDICTSQKAANLMQLVRPWMGKRRTARIDECLAAWSKHAASKAVSTRASVGP